ncbi:MAG TPA: Rv3235 family protein [Trebonia sp.]|jgi:hypothetical protein|nr:Rv3235 family protein [Trebonia sp.]
MPTSQADDLSAIRLLELADLGPPFDDDPAAAGRAAADAVAARDHPSGPGTAALAPRQNAAVAPGLDADGDWARQFARLLTEALSGARPVRQILPCTSERARIQLHALMPLFSGGQRPRLLRVIATRPARDVIEMTVIAGLGARTRALAVRLQRADPAERPPAWLTPADPAGQRQVSALPARPTAPRWLCTDIEAA